MPERIATYLAELQARLMEDRDTLYASAEPVVIRHGPHAACNVSGFDLVADGAKIVMFHSQTGPADIIHATAWGRDWSLPEVGDYVMNHELPADAGKRKEPATVLVYGTGKADADLVRLRLATRN